MRKCRQMSNMLFERARVCWIADLFIFTNRALKNPAGERRLYAAGEIGFAFKLEAFGICRQALFRCDQFSKRSNPPEAVGEAGAGAEESRAFIFLRLPGQKSTDEFRKLELASLLSCSPSPGATTSSFSPPPPAPPLTSPAARSCLPAIFIFRIK